MCFRTKGRVCFNGIQETATQLPPMRLHTLHISPCQPWGLRRHIASRTLNSLEYVSQTLFQRHAALLVTNNAVCLISGFDLRMWDGHRNVVQRIFILSVFLMFNKMSANGTRRSAPFNNIIVERRDETTTTTNILLLNGVTRRFPWQHYVVSRIVSGLGSFSHQVFRYSKWSQVLWPEILFKIMPQGAISRLPSRLSPKANAHTTPDISSDPFLTMAFIRSSLSRTNSGPNTKLFCIMCVPVEATSRRRRYFKPQLYRVLFRV